MTAYNRADNIETVSDRRTNLKEKIEKRRTVKRHVKVDGQDDLYYLINELAGLGSDDTLYNMSDDIKQLLSDKTINIANKIFKSEEQINELLNEYVEIIAAQKLTIEDYKSRLNAFESRDKAIREHFREISGVGEDIEGLRAELYQLNCSVNKMSDKFGYRFFEDCPEKLIDIVYDIRKRLEALETKQIPEVSIAMVRLHELENRVKALEPK